MLENHTNDFLHIERLGHDCHSTSVQKAIRGGIQNIGRGSNHWGRLVTEPAVNLYCRLRSIQVGHMEVHDDAIEWVALAGSSNDSSGRKVA